MTKNKHGYENLKETEETGPINMIDESSAEETELLNPSDDESTLEETEETELLNLSDDKSTDKKDESQGAEQVKQISVPHTQHLLRSLSDSGISYRDVESLLPREEERSQAPRQRSKSRDKNCLLIYLHPWNLTIWQKVKFTGSAIITASLATTLLAFIWESAESDGIKKRNIQVLSGLSGSVFGMFTVGMGKLAEKCQKRINANRRMGNP